MQDEFNTWLTSEKELISRLDESEIDMSCKSDLFDVLDAVARCLMACWSLAAAVCQRFTVTSRP